MEVTHLEYTTCRAAVQSFSLCVHTAKTFSIPALEFFPSSHALSSRSISPLQLRCSFPLCTSVCSTTLCTCTGLSYLYAQNKPSAFVSLSAPHFLLSALSICIRCAMLCPPAVVPSPSCSRDRWQHPGQSLSWAAPGVSCSTAEQLISPRPTAQRGRAYKGPTWLKVTLTTWFLPTILTKKKSILTKPLGVRRSLLAFRQRQVILSL